VGFLESCSLSGGSPSCPGPQGLKGGKPLMRLDKKTLSTATGGLYYYDYF